jgi:hypothetical protein
MTGDPLDLAVRAWVPPPEQPDSGRPEPAPSLEPIPRQLLILDTETTTDETQKLNFGVWRYCRVNYEESGVSLTCLSEGLFYANELPQRDRTGYLALRAYAATHDAAVDHAQRDAARPLRLEPLDQWLKRVFWRVAYKLRGCVVCFNLPFDLSRLAWRVGETRNRSHTRDPFADGFSFALWSFERDGRRVESRHRPRVVIKAIDSKRALKGFRTAEFIDSVNLIPEDPGSVKPAKQWRFRGHLLDLRTLAFALTDRGHTLESACEAFEVRYTKREVEHGKITSEYIDYGREDVDATQDLCAATLTEFLRHPIDLQATRAYSPATIGKGYMRKIGVRPPLERQKISPETLGWSMSAYYGGRSEVRGRRVPFPVVYVDFLSMYPTVCALMGVWRLLTAERVQVVDVTDEVRATLESVTIEDCFRPRLWPQLVGIAQIAPDGDVLPVRARYGAQPGWQIGVNPLQSDQPMWFPIADLIKSKLITSKPPRILRALRFKPRGKTGGLQSVKLLGEVPVSPDEDFFRVMIEQRKRAELRGTSDEKRRAKALKVTASATSYGIYAQMTRRELGGGRTEPVTVYGFRDEPHTWSVSAPEEPGEYAFPALAACITGAAHLVLGMLECLVAHLDGSHVFCDTDSMAIVASEQGGLIPCPGGPHQREGGDAVRALSFDQVEAIRSRFETLNPYDRNVVRGSILEIEDENFADASRRERRQLHCLAISAKRYVLYHLGEDGQPLLVKWSGHGLGHLLNPTDPDSTDRDWIRQAWEWLLRRHLGLNPTEPRWLDHPAIARHSTSSPSLHRLLVSLNDGLPYAEQIKPFNFLAIAFVHPLERPPDDSRLVLIAPYRSRVTEQLQQTWTNRYSSKRYRVTTEPSHSVHRPGVVTVKTYRDVLAEYAVHPEAKSNGPDGRSCRRQTVGLLARRPVTARTISHIGKEANRLEEARAGLLQDADEVLSAYDDVELIAFREWALPILQKLGVREVARRTGHSVGAVHAVLQEQASPRSDALKRYLDIASRRSR